jgi:hypothetical protein
MTTTSTTAPADTTAPAAAPAAPPPEAAKPAEAAAPAEAAPPEKPAPRKADEWQRISAEEKRIRKERERVETERKAFAEERKAHQERVALIERAKAGDWEAREKLLAETGVTYDELTKRALNSRKGDSVAEKTARELADLQAKIDAKEKAEAAAMEAAVWKSSVSDFYQHVAVEAKDKFPHLNVELETDGDFATPEALETELRRQVAEAQKDGRDISVGDAARALEDRYRRQYERRVARLRPATPPPAEQTSTTKPRDQRGRFERGDGPRKLTNDLSAERSSPPKGRNEPSRPLTMRERDEANRERLRRAASAMR